MIMNERQSDIVKLLRKEERVSVKKLAEHFYVSEMTIRRDLKELEASGYLKRYNGGAVYKSDELLPINKRRYIHLNKRNVITEHAKKYLHNSMNIFLDSSSTCTNIISVLREYDDITIVTNSVQNVLFASKYHIKCILIGGNYYERDMCSVGSLAENFAGKINTDAAFFSVMGCSEDGIISDDDEAQTGIRKIAMKNSKVNVFFFDKEKRNKKYLYTLCSADEADEVIFI